MYVMLLRGRLVAPGGRAAEAETSKQLILFALHAMVAEHRCFTRPAFCTTKAVLTMNYSLYLLQHRPSLLSSKMRTLGTTPTEQLCHHPSMAVQVCSIALCLPASGEAVGLLKAVDASSFATGNMIPITTESDWIPKRDFAITCWHFLI